MPNQLNHMYLPRYNTWPSRRQCIFCISISLLHAFENTNENAWRIACSKVVQRVTEHQFAVHFCFLLSHLELQIIASTFQYRRSNCFDFYSITHLAYTPMNQYFICALNASYCHAQNVNKFPHFFFQDNRFYHSHYYAITLLTLLFPYLCLQHCFAQDVGRRSKQYFQSKAVKIFAPDPRISTLLKIYFA